MTKSHTILIIWHDKQPQVLCLFIINNISDIIYNVEQICHQPDRFLFGLYLIKECRSIVRDESSVYFNVTAVNRYDI